MDDEKDNKNAPVIYSAAQISQERKKKVWEEAKRQAKSNPVSQDELYQFDEVLQGIVARTADHIKIVVFIGFSLIGRSFNFNNFSAEGCATVGAVVIASGLLYRNICDIYLYNKLIIDKLAKDIPIKNIFQ